MYTRYVYKITRLMILQKKHACIQSKPPTVVYHEVFSFESGPYHVCKQLSLVVPLFI